MTPWGRSCRAAALLATLAIPAAAQAPVDSACTFDGCALRFDGAALVRGVRAERVGLPLVPGALAGRVAGDSAERWAIRSRSLQRVSVPIGLGAAALVLGAVHGDIGHQGGRGFLKGRRVQLAVAGIAVAAATIPLDRRAFDASSRALWWHNRAFVASPDAAPAGVCTYDACALRVANGRLYRGLASEPIGRVGATGKGLARAVAGSDSASAYARRFRRDARRPPLPRRRRRRARRHPRRAAR